MTRTRGSRGQEKKNTSMEHGSTNVVLAIGREREKIHCRTPEERRYAIHADNTWSSIQILFEIIILHLIWRRKKGGSTGC
jgi:hypothetical protein